MHLTTNDPTVKKFLDDRPRILQEQLEMAKLKINPYNPFCDVMPDGAWQGERCFIIGGGPSLMGFDFERLRDQGRIIAINKAFKDVPFADILFFMDYRNFYARLLNGELGQEIIESWNAFQGYKVFLDLVGHKAEGAYTVRSLSGGGLSRSLKTGIYFGNNSGVGAIGLALCLQANPIYLLGIDCKLREDGKAHYHEGYGVNVKLGEVANFIPDFESLHRYLNSTDFQVINLNPDSGLRCFPFSTINEVLNNEG